MRSWRTLLVLVLVVMLVLSAVDAKRKKKPKPKPMLDPFVPDSPERAQCKLLCRNNFNVQADMCRLYGVNRQVCYDNAGYILRDCYNHCTLLPIWNPNEAPLGPNDWAR